VSENAGSTTDVQRVLERVWYNQCYYKLNNIQNNIFKVIDKSPGIRYRELARQTGFANGVLTYHLNILEQFRYISKFKHNNITRYYPHSIPNSEQKIISHLRVHSERDIILFLLSHDLCTFSEIVQYLRKAPSTVSWHLKRLCEDGILAVHHGEYNLYRINDKKLVNQMLHKYKESFTDKVVNNFVDIADEV
jgi:predicted transcriptional regulator